MQIDSEQFYFSIKYSTVTFERKRSNNHYSCKKYSANKTCFDIYHNSFWYTSKRIIMYIKNREYSWVPVCTCVPPIYNPGKQYNFRLQLQLIYFIRQRLSSYFATSEHSKPGNVLRQKKKAGFNGRVKANTKFYRHTMNWQQ